MTIDQHDHSEHSKQFDYVNQDCPNCGSTGEVHLSCCGDDISNQDDDICPTCKEHCGDEPETCEDCKGEGIVID